jgi:hypothetical protein
VGELCHLSGRLPTFTRLSHIETRFASMLAASVTTRSSSLAAALRDHICDVGDIWNDCSMSQQVAYVESAFALCRQIEEGGYFCCVGRFQQQLRAKDRARLIFNAGSILASPRASPAPKRSAIEASILRQASEPAERPRGAIAMRQ